jgi:tetratricopeptide (TPR) repeat protein
MDAARRGRSRRHARRDQPGARHGADPIIAVKLEVALLGFWMLRGYSTEGRNYVRAALALPAVQESDLAHAHALYVGAVLAHGQGDNAEAVRMLEACLVLRRGLGKQVDIAATLSTLSLVRMHVGDAERARQSEGEAVSIFRELKDRRGEAIGLVHLGQICAYFADDPQARGYFEQSLAIGRAIKNQEIESECELLLGELALDEGDLPSARQRFERSLAVCRGAEIKRGEATALWWIGKADLAGGDHDSARARLGEPSCLPGIRDERNIVCLEDQRRSHITKRGCAVALRGGATAEQLSLSRSPLSNSDSRSKWRQCGDTLGDGDFDAAWSEG